MDDSKNDFKLLHKTLIEVLNLENCELESRSKEYQVNFYLKI